MKSLLVYGLCSCLLAMTAIATAANTLPAGIMPINGTAAPALKLDDLDGASYDLEASHGRWRFVHFWASWCGPCRKEMPSIERMVTALGDNQLQIVLVNTAETEDEVFTFIAIVAPELVPLMDTDGQVTEAWQPRGLPATYLVDPLGKIRYQALGGRDWDRPEYLEFLRGLGTTDPPGQ